MREKGYRLVPRPHFALTMATNEAQPDYCSEYLPMATNEAQPDYCSEYLPPDVIEKLEAGAFRCLTKHLQERSNEVQNMELMTMSGFCRNCLAKWMVLEARKLVDSSSNDDQLPVQALNALGYEQAAQHVYGMTYDEWKKRHQTKATQAQMERYNDARPLHALHDKDILNTRSDKPTTSPQTLASNVCCENIDQAEPEPKAVAPAPAKQSRSVGPFQPPPVPALSSPVRVGILTVSDRASRNEYETGDLSGPAVEKAARKVTGNLQTLLAIVPDNVEAIQTQLQTWSEEGFDLILTTGGTGLSPTDVTPEATRAILDLECAGLMSFVTTESSHLQPLSSLSRGTAGICKKTLIANLPGNPKGVSEVVPLLLPLLLHAVADLGGPAVGEI
jgi:molybdopterin adenylyltransferase